MFLICLKHCHSRESGNPGNNVITNNFWIPACAGMTGLATIYIMSLFHTIILGIVEGITEFLPISSTGHMILTARLLNLPSTEFLKSFEIAIQLGAILAVVVLYFKKFILNLEAIKKVIVAFLPTGILGLIFYKIVKTYLLGSENVVLWTLFLGGIFLIVFEYWYEKKMKKTEIATLPTVARNDVENISYKQSFLIGIFQSLAMIPGMSRSASTIVGGLILGLKRQTIVEFSFLLAVPTMMSATGLDLIKTAPNFSNSEWGSLIIGFVVSFFVAILAIKWLLKFIQNHSFIGFGIYRIVVAVLFWIVVYNH